MDDLMEIGRFAAASELSIDALRHYDEVGVLKPASVDPRTSYRRYRAEQVRDARIICHLRGVDLPLADVRAVLQAGGDGDRVTDILQRHRARLARRASALERMMAASEAFTDHSMPVAPANGARVVQVMASCRDRDVSVRFYCETFGWEFQPAISSFVLGAWRTDSFFLLAVEDWLDGGSPSAFGLLVDDVDLRHARALQHGAVEVSAPASFDWKPRASVVDDPAGNRIQLSQG